MKKYRYETHAHTKEVSPCGQIEAAKGVRMHKEAGFQGIVYTDHFHKKYFSSLGDIPWEEKIDSYLSGFRAAREEGEKLDMDILWGIELRFTDNNNDFLVYGLTEDFLKKHANLYESRLALFYNEVKNDPGVLVFQAHPFRPGCFLADTNFLDGIEIFNGNPRHDSSNQKAAEAARRAGLLIDSGSDFHRPEDLASGGFLCSERIRNNEDLIRKLKSLDCSDLVTREDVCK